MLSYRYFWTKMLSLYSGFALKSLMESITQAKDYKDQVKIAEEGRKNANRSKSMLKINSSVKKVRKTKLGQCAIYIYEPEEKSSEDPVIFFPGGGFIVGGNGTHGAIASDIAATLGRQVCLIEYALVPESKIKQTTKKCVESILLLLDQSKTVNYTLCGHSAGAGLICQIVIQLIKENQPLPRCLYLVSPSLQHCFSGDKLEILEKCKTDEILGKTYNYLMNDESARQKAVALLGGKELPEVLDVEDKILKKFPPIHMTYQNDEVLSIAIRQTIRKFRSLDVEVVDNSVDNSFHSFLVFNYLPQTKVYLTQLKKAFDQEKQANKNG